MFAIGFSGGFVIFLNNFYRKFGTPLPKISRKSRMEYQFSRVEKMKRFFLTSEENV
jgi:hypothetical protein